MGSDDDKASSFDEAIRATEARVSVVINESGISSQAVVSAEKGVMQFDGLTGGPSVCLPSCDRACYQLVRGEQDADTVSLIF